jgi:glycerol kinase
MQFQSDMLGVPVEVPAVAETTALGAGYLAGLAVGFWTSREELESKWQMGRRYAPRMGAAERGHLYARWRQAVERSKGWARVD